MAHSLCDLSSSVPKGARGSPTPTTPGFITHRCPAGPHLAPSRAAPRHSEAAEAGAAQEALGNGQCSQFPPRVIHVARQGAVSVPFLGSGCPEGKREGRSVGRAGRACTSQQRQLSDDYQALTAVSPGHPLGEESQANGASAQHVRPSQRLPWPQVRGWGTGSGWGREGSRRTQQLREDRKG